MRAGPLILACLCVGCQSTMRGGAVQRTPPDAAAWAGVYATADDRDDSAQVLSIRWITLPDETSPRPIYHLFARLGRDARIDVVGAARIDGDRLTFAIASANVDDEGDPHAVATIERYVYRRLKDRVVLLRDDAAAGHPRDGSLDGVLLKIADDPATLEANAPATTMIAHLKRPL